MKALLAVFFLLACLTGTIYATNNQQQRNTCDNCVCPGIKNHWHASLLPAEEVPPVNSSATAIGSIILSLETTNNQTDNLLLRYHLFLKGSNINAAHIHVGSRCTAGPIVAFLAGPFLGNGTSLPNGGLLAEGVITSANLTGPLAGFTIFDLVQEIEAGNAYVNVHSVRFPAGETRGHLQALQEDTKLTSDLLNAMICNGEYNSFLHLLAANASSSNTPSSTFPANYANLNETEEANLRLSLLAGNGTYTIFAPTDDNWKLGQNDTITTARAFLELQIVSGAYTFADFLGKVTVLKSLSGVDLTVDGVQPNQTTTSLVLKAVHHARVTVNGVLIVEPDAVIASNGIVQGMAAPIPATAPTTTTTPSTSAPQARRFRKFRRERM